MVSTGISGSGTVSSTAMIAASSILGSWASAPISLMLHPFERERDALADADAHRREGALATVPMKLLRGRQRKPGPRHAERMAKRDRPAVRVHAWIVVGDSKLPKYGQALSGEGFVQFDHV